MDEPTDVAYLWNTLLRARREGYKGKSRLQPTPRVLEILRMERSRFVDSWHETAPGFSNKDQVFQILDILSDKRFLVEERDENISKMLTRLEQLRTASQVVE